MNYRSIIILPLLLVSTIALYGCDKQASTARGVSEIDRQFNDALANRNLDIAAELLTKGADVNCQFENADGFTNLIMISTGPGFERGIEFLLSKGADPNAVTDDGKTALHYAARQGNIKYVELLLRSSANPAIAASDGSTPLSVAVQSGHQEVADMIREHIDTIKNDS